MAYNKSERPDSPMKRRGGRRRKKVCVFCGKENNEIDYKDVNKLMNIHGKSLLAGNAYCGHCGAKLELTSSRKWRKMADGSLDRKSVV